MTKEQAQEKISKLLKLSESPNQNEAFAALAKAQEIALKFGLEMKKLKAEVLEKTIQSHYKNFPKWYRLLLSVIAQHFRCREMTVQGYKPCTEFSVRGSKSTQVKVDEIIFIGMPSDVDIATQCLQYSVNSMNKLWSDWYEGYSKGTNTAVKRTKEWKNYVSKVKRNYREGFGMGLNDVLTQNEEQYGLVVVIPSEVEDYCSEMHSDVRILKARQSNGELISQAYRKGYKDGSQTKPETMHTMIGG